MSLLCGCGTSVACKTMVRDDLGSIFIQDDIFREALISLLSENGLQTNSCNIILTCNNRSVSVESNISFLSDCQ